MKARSLALTVASAALLAAAGLYGCNKAMAPERAMAPAQDEAKAAAASPGSMGVLALKKQDLKGKKGKVTTWKRSRVVPHTSKLSIGDDEQLPLAGMQAHVQIDGFRARVALDCYFYNDRDRQFEGTFKLRLPPGASPYYLAFGKTSFKAEERTDLSRPVFFDEEQAKKQGTDPEQLRSDRAASWSAPKEARMVPREKAAHAYGQTVRRRVDPALMEWSGAGVFSARVFPLEAKKLHRIVVAYDLDLTPAGDDLEVRFDIPGHKAETIVDLDIAKLPGVKVAIAPDVTPTPHKGRLFARFDNPKQRTITVRLRDPGPLLLRGEDPATGPLFAAAFRARLPVQRAKPAKTKAVFVVDTSLSANPDLFNVQLKLLEAILAKNRPSLAQFAVLFFNIESHWWKGTFVQNSAENAQALLAYAQTLALEGATDLGAALAEASRPTRFKPGEKDRWDLFLLSDGASTWGESDEHRVAATLRGGRARALFAYTTGMAGTDRQTLARLSRDSGGALFSVVGEAELDEAATAHRDRPWQIEEVSVEGGSDLMLAGRPRTLFGGQRVLLVGRGALEPGAKVVLKLRRGEGKPRPFTFELARAVKSQLASRAYGAVAVGQLEEFVPVSEEHATAYACHFRVPGKTSSLLMLESEADYKRHNIKPEEHAFVVKARPAAALVAELLQRIGDTLVNPKKAFLSWLKRLEKTPGVTFSLPTALKLALGAMPKASFAVEVPPLQAKERSREALPKELRQNLAARKLDYVQISKEAERRARALGPGDALRGLSSLVENSPGDTVLARDVGLSAVALGLAPHAYHLFRRVAQKRPYEPQTYRAMANVLATMGKDDLALAHYELALAGKWDSRFGEFEKIVTLDYLRFLRRALAAQKKTKGSDQDKSGEQKPGEGEQKPAALSVPDFARARLKTLSAGIDFTGADLVVVITWNTDNSDVDLHVVEPTGEECYYENRETKIGGRLTTDVTQGYGPEMYTLKKAEKGTYTVKVKYFASVQNRATARTKVHATVIRRFGTAQETRTQKAVILTEGKEMHTITTVKIP